MFLADVPSSLNVTRTLSKNQKSDYIKAVRCLQSLLRKGNVTKARTRFDDFQATHIALADEVHLVGQFLPWHRFFLHIYETALRDECGYRGTSPYAASPVFDPVDGFGGNGEDIPGYDGQFHNLTNIPGWQPGTGGGCVKDGPFVHYNLSLGPGTLATNHCIQRAFTPAFLPTITPEQVEITLNKSTFESFRIELEGTPVTSTVKIHDGGHLSVLGEMGDRYSSPGDPLFYLHHASLDRVWWNWQQADLDKRLYQISGRSSVDPPFHNVTLDFQLKSEGLWPLIPLRQVMDPRNEFLCYTYV
ncbi:Di-copper centre-containing protein [Marasmius fiardii PR-910]|nr:Di-copper centre-containing protein [Marasmius fiardii PR-910]